MRGIRTIARRSGPRSFAALILAAALVIPSSALVIAEESSAQDIASSSTVAQQKPPAKAEATARRIAADHARRFARKRDGTAEIIDWRAHIVSPQVVVFSYELVAQIPSYFYFHRSVLCRVEKGDCTTATPMDGGFEAALDLTGDAAPELILRESVSHNTEVQEQMRLYSLAPKRATAPLAGIAASSSYQVGLCDEFCGTRLTLTCEPRPGQVPVVALETTTRDCDPECTSIRTHSTMSRYRWDKGQNRFVRLKP
jgi:hypothetical protein